MSTCFSGTRHVRAILVVLAILLRATDAFRAAVAHSTRRNSSAVASLQAWTLLPADATFKSPWYDECNPTARTTVYADSYSSLDSSYSFMTLGDDWPSMQQQPQDDEQAPTGQRRRRVNPLRRALRRRSLRRTLRRAQQER